jgi:hypothetical protein
MKQRANQEEYDDQTMAIGSVRAHFSYPSRRLPFHYDIFPIHRTFHPS